MILAATCDSFTLSTAGFHTKPFAPTTIGAFSREGERSCLLFSFAGLRFAYCVKKRCVRVFLMSLGERMRKGDHGGCLYTSVENDEKTCENSGCVIASW